VGVVGEGIAERRSGFCHPDTLQWTLRYHVTPQAKTQEFSFVVGIIVPEAR
jgi:hypothetical protein